MRINEHFTTDKKGYIFKYLIEHPTYKMLHQEKCFVIVDSAYSFFRLKLMELLCITWFKSNLHKQKEYVISPFSANYTFS